MSADLRAYRRLDRRMGAFDPSDAPLEHRFHVALRRSDEFLFRVPRDGERPAWIWWFDGIAFPCQEFSLDRAAEWFAKYHRPLPPILAEDLAREAAPSIAPTPPAADPAGTPRGESPAAGPEVILGKPGDEPIVNGKRKPRLTVAGHDIIKALLNAGDLGLTGDDLVVKSGHGGAVNTLKALAGSDPDWEAVISLAGRPGGRYRIIGQSDGS